MLDPEPADPRAAFRAEGRADLARARVAVLGCGSVGSLAAWFFASAGVGRLELADRDILEEANLRRHLGSAADLGHPKAAVVARHLERRLPRLDVRCQDFCFLEDPLRLRAILQAVDIALVAVDDEAPKHLIDGMARALQRPTVYAGVYGGGFGTEVLFCDPSTACYGCSAAAMDRSGVAWTPTAASADYALPSPGPSGDWLRADLGSIAPCAALAAQVTVAWLSQQRGQGAAWNEFCRGDSRAWRLALRHVPAWDQGPWVLRPQAVTRHPDCLVCSAAALNSPEPAPEVPHDRI